ncbi:MAG: hypothetical protein DMF09_01580, partial [Verrucomicrobia bacterium]
MLVAASTEPVNQAFDANASVLIPGATFRHDGYRASTLQRFNGACLLLAGNGGVTISEQYIDSGLAALIVAIVPIYIVLLAWATGMARRPIPVVWLGLVGGFLGVGT